MSSVQIQEVFELWNETGRFVLHRGGGGNVGEAISMLILAYLTRLSLGEVLF